MRPTRAAQSFSLQPHASRPADNFKMCKYPQTFFSPFVSLHFASSAVRCVLCAHAGCHHGAEILQRRPCRWLSGVWGIQAALSDLLPPFHCPSWCPGCPNHAQVCLHLALKLLCWLSAVFQPSVYRWATNAYLSQSVYRRS